MGLMTIRGVWRVRKVIEVSSVIGRTTVSKPREEGREIRDYASKDRDRTQAELKAGQAPAPTLWNRGIEEATRYFNSSCLALMELVGVRFFFVSNRSI